MRRVSGTMRAGTAPIRAGTRRSIRPTTAAAGGAGLILLSLLFWYIFYQNLPGDFGLNKTGDDIISQGNTVDRIVKLCMLAVSIYIIATRWSLTRSLAKHINLGAAAILALAALSAKWSIDRDATLLRFISLLAIVMICFSISLAGWHRRRFQQLAVPPLMYILLASLVLGIIFPDRIAEIGDDLSLKGAWHGITITKNQFGMTASLAIIICVNRWLAGEQRASWAIAGTAVSVVCLILSRSNTSLFATLLATLFMVLVVRVPMVRQQFTTPLAVGIGATLLVYELAIQNVIPGAYTLLSPIMSLTGKDATLSARTDIWDIIKEHIQAAPYLGTGYGAYWVGAVRESPSYIFVYKMYFYPTEAHNGYLDIINDLGYVGLSCLVAFLFLYVRQALQLMKTDRNQAALYLALLFQQMVLNMSESEWFSRDSTFTILILAMMCLARAVHDSHRQASSAVSAKA
jgi:exopolysaccharide production protein ExoQ